MQFTRQTCSKLNHQNYSKLSESGAFKANPAFKVTFWPSYLPLFIWCYKQQAKILELYFLQLYIWPYGLILLVSYYGIFIEKFPFYHLHLFVNVMCITLCVRLFHSFTFITLCQTLILRLHQPDCVVDLSPVQAPLHPGGLLVDLRQIFHVPVLGLHLLLQARAPPGPSVLWQGFEQRREDAAVRVGEVVQRAGGGQRRCEQRAAAGDQQQEGDRAEITKGGWHQHLFSHDKQHKNNTGQKSGRLSAESSRSTRPRGCRCWSTRAGVCNQLHHSCDLIR